MRIYRIDKRILKKNSKAYMVQENENETETLTNSESKNFQKSPYKSVVKEEELSTNVETGNDKMEYDYETISLLNSLFMMKNMLCTEVDKNRNFIGYLVNIYQHMNHNHNHNHQEQTC